ISNFVPTKRNLREALLFYFHLKKNAAESQRMLSEAYGNYIPSVSTYEY
ncbi:Mariner Mos1 transposase, partial [Acromyrmex echinatior]